jgi:hypothetical protein
VIKLDEAFLKFAGDFFKLDSDLLKLDTSLHGVGEDFLKIDETLHLKLETSIPIPGDQGAVPEHSNPLHQLLQAAHDFLHI